MIAVLEEHDNFIKVPDDLILVEYECDKEKKVWFDESLALAELMLNDVVCTNSRWWCDCDKEEISVFVNCNDIFLWAASDAETLPYSEIENLWRMWRRDPAWGSAVWCIQRRGYMPQKPVADGIRKAGIWDLNVMGLDPSIDERRKQKKLDKEEEKD